MGSAKKRKRRRQPANRARSSGPSPFTAVYSFLPLEAPLSIPDKSILRSQEKPPPKPGLEDDYLVVEGRAIRVRLPPIAAPCAPAVMPLAANGRGRSQSGMIHSVIG